MRRLLMFITTLMLIAATLLPQPASAITLEQADAVCNAFSRDHYTSCRILGGTVQRCLDESWQKYYECMAWHGFSPNTPRDN